MSENISPNKKLAHYTIVCKIGAGGMGEVYRARDTRLNREVAIKLLPSEFARDTDRLRRFEQEARATSALNHPNILTIYDIGTHEGTPFIVAELLEGEELRELLNDGPLTFRKALDYAQQVALGLAAAHGKAIVHRDLKPENLFVTHDGRVKILDFGLAKLIERKREGETGRGGDNFSPAWSPDGKQFAFSTTRDTPPNLYLKPPIGNASEVRLQKSPLVSFPSSWSPDGKFLIFSMLDPKTQYDIWLLPMTGERKPQPLLQTKVNEQFGKVSPDGNWLAYQSDEAGSEEIYVTQFPQPAHSWRISTSGGVNSFWRGDGKELYFVAGNKLMAVSVSGGTEFQSGTPQPLFEIEGTRYAPSKDGRRFLTVVVTEKAPAPPINVVLNWTADLKK